MPRKLQSRTCPICLSDPAEVFCEVRGNDRLHTSASEAQLPGNTIVYRCKNCTLGWIDPVPSARELAGYYTSSYLGDVASTVEGFLAGQLQRSRSWKNELDKARLVERFVAGGRILDVGCGDGKFLCALDRRRWERSGIEAIGSAVSLVRSKLSDLSLVAGDVLSAQLPEESFDVVTLWHVLEHLPEPQKVIQRVRGLLAPGGWLFISLPNFESWQASIFRRHWYALDVPRHLYFFSPRSLRLLLTETGLIVVRNAFFSRRASFHQLKHSALNWSQSAFGSRFPYYCIKPILGIACLLENVTEGYGVLTTVARKAPNG